MRLDSRMDKYRSNQTSGATSRSSRNRKLYDEIYSNTEYSNSVVLDDSKEIDINVIKEIIDKQEIKEEKRNARPTLDFYQDLKILNEEVDEKVYDINEVLKESIHYPERLKGSFVDWLFASFIVFLYSIIFFVLSAFQSGIFSIFLMILTVISALVMCKQVEFSSTSYNLSPR